MLNRRAMHISSEKLVEELQQAIREKSALLQQRDVQYGTARPRILSYGENLYLPETFGFDMRDYYQNPELSLEIALRSALFWAQNSHDDELPSLVIPPCSSMYFDMTLFGMRLDYTRDGVPLFQPHPLQEKADFSVIKPFDFYATGEMPAVLHQFEEMKRLAHQRYGDELQFEFPRFQRGPLDVLVQLRGYENFVEDVYENPAFIHEAMERIVEDRFRFRQEAGAYLGVSPATLPVAIHDDWVNVPFISAEIFDTFVAPAYRKIQENEGPVTCFHTCGVMVPLAQQLKALFPAIQTWDISGWNDFRVLDTQLPETVGFGVNFINTFVLVSPREEHMRKLLDLKAVAAHRPLSVCAQAMVRLHPTLDETLERMNTFIDLARGVFAGEIVQ